MNTTLTQPHKNTGEPLIIERFLREREGVWRQIQQEYQLDALIRQMLISSTIGLGGYGAVIGLSHSVLQALASAIKLPILFLMTLAICLPTLYLFNLLFGGRLSIRQSLALVLAAITVTASLALAFAPITLFFMITARSYHFFILLNVSILTLAAGIGLSFLISGMRSINTLTATLDLPVVPDAPAPAAAVRPQNISMALLYTWLMLYGFVGTQLGWTLRPVFGDPDQPFVLFRAIEGNFYSGVFETLISLMLR